MALPTTPYNQAATIIPRKSFVVFTPIAGVQQVETATVAGTPTSGTLPVTVTGPGITGSPLVTNVTVLAGDSLAMIAAKIRLALAAVPAITNVLGITFDGSNDVRLTVLANTAANDAVLSNISWTAVAGLTAVVTSVTTVAGIASGSPISMVGKALDYGNKITTVDRKVPDAAGLLRPDRIVAVEQMEDISFEVEDVKLATGLIAIFGGLNGGLVQGRAQFWVVDPSDTGGLTSAKSNNFLCTCEMDGGIKFDAGKVSSAKLKFVALEKMIITQDAVA